MSAPVSDTGASGAVPRPTTAKDAVGAYGERVAAQHLYDAGYAMLARNWRCPDGEIDIVARDGDTIVFCEVKTRRGNDFGLPIEAVDEAKAARLRRLATRWLTESGTHAPQVRFDVVSVWPQPKGAARVEHVPGAF